MSVIVVQRSTRGEVVSAVGVVAVEVAAGAVEGAVEGEVAMKDHATLDGGTEVVDLEV